MIAGVVGLAVGCGKDAVGPTSDAPPILFAHTDGPLVTPALHAGPGLSGNPTCFVAFEGFAGIDFKIPEEGSPPESGTYELAPGIAIELEISEDGISASFTADILIDGVIVKGGPNANAYDYRPIGGTDHDNGLVSPDHPEPGDIPAISHINFCVTPRVQVSKTAETTFTRTHHWDLDKVGSTTELTLNPGNIAAVDYTVTVTYEGSVDSDWAVSGTITVTNPWPDAAVIASVTDEISGVGAVAVDCGEATIPGHSLAGEGGVLACTYGAALPDGDSRVNTATVTTSSGPAGGSATADVEFGDPTTEVDACIEVFDDKTDPENPVALGTVCADDEDIVATGETDFDYQLHLSFGAQDCGELEVTNTAFFELEDGTEVTSSWTIAVTVECVDGCTLTPGYWKTHNDTFKGGAPSDPTWQLLGADAEGTAFFLSGQSYFEALWTAPQGGNAYYILAHAYIAAELNGLAGADLSAVQDEFNAATALFEAWTPAAVGALRGNNPTRQQFLSLAAVLDDYNNGLIGPGHCDG